MPLSASSAARAESGLQLCSEVAVWDKLMPRRVQGALFGLAVRCSGAAVPDYSIHSLPCNLDAGACTQSCLPATVIKTL